MFWQTWGRGYNLVDRLSWKLRSDGIVLAIISEPKGLSFNVQSSSANESTRFQSPAFQFNNFFYQNSVVG
ncbi:hypothetical protein LEP1GSC158_0336 [Leptospira interrogans serovar Zanoni str. LT2156]|uniref:Uncharacterized protein n=2 Tax=Leptospira interrogans TaxID=173 RepID=M6HPY1_LEPIR|nr:hypothetical protein LEP1GSC158_0336 [Leptospira interrogans serovar Zanoni str. LT2156]